jgi:hypothetical protein
MREFGPHTEGTPSMFHFRTVPIGVTFSQQQGAFPVGRVAVFRKVMIVEAEYY